MVSVRLILLILGFICFVLSTVGVAARVNLQSLGLAFWILTAFVA